MTFRTQKDFLGLKRAMATNVRVSCRQTLMYDGAKDLLWSAFSSPSLPKSKVWEGRYVEDAGCSKYTLRAD